MKYILIMLTIFLFACGDETSDSNKSNCDYKTTGSTCVIGGIEYDDNNLPLINFYYDDFEGPGIDFTFTNLKEIPSCIGNLKNIKILILHETSIENIPESICSLENLEYLDASEIWLKSLPENLCELTNLKFLDLNENSFTNLPNNIGNLKNLKYLNLDDNSLVTLPISISELKNNLEILSIQGSNFSESYKSKVENMLPKTNILW